MNVSPRDSASDEAWKTFAAARTALDPGATIRSQHHPGGGGGGDDGEEALPRPAPPVTIKRGGPSSS
jgi:hypothetical protein